MRSIWKDIRFATRTLRRSPGVTILAIGSLALAIAGNTIVFSLINGLLYRPLPYEQPNRLSLVGEQAKDMPAGFVTPVSGANFLDWQERATVFSDMAAFRGQPFRLGSAESQESISGAAVSTSFFDVLGTPPVHGRSFSASEGVAGLDRVVLLDHGFWQDRFAGRREAVGESLELNGETYDIVGVLSEDFEFLAPNTQVFVPLALERGQLERHRRDLLVVGRLADGVGDGAAKQEMVRIMEQLEDEFPDANLGYTVEVLNLREEIPDRRNRLFFQMIQGALLFVLLIACANVANLLLARSQKREREMAVRSSLGASRTQIVRQLFVESLVMALIGGAVGLGLAWYGNELVSQAMAAQLPSIYAPVIDGRVLAFNLGVTLFGAVLFSLAPTLQTFRSDLLGALKEGTKSSASGRKRWVSNALVVGELTLALIFLGGASILLRSFELLQDSDPGFETAHLQTLQMTLPETRYDSPETLVAATDELLERLGSLPGVESTLVANALPRTIFLPRDIVTIEGEPPPPETSLPRTEWLSISTDFFSTLGMRARSGRVFDQRERPGSAPVAVVNQSFVDRHLAEGEPLGRRLTLQGRTWEVVGVVDDVRHGLAINDRFGPMVYLPWAQAPQSSIAVCLRMDPAKAAAFAGDALNDTLRREVQSFDAGIGVTQILSLDAFIDQFWAGQKVFSVILRSFGGLALLLAALGTYGVLAYSVVQRTAEIGIRIAVGADRAAVVRMVLRQGLTLAALGIALGIPGIWLVNQGLKAVMAGFVPVEAGSVTTGVAVLLAVTFFASLFPALRASSIDPAEALRGD